MEGKRIVAVDDDAQVLTLLQDVLARQYCLVTVKDPTLALDAIRTSKPDLVLLDLHMPEMSGWAIYNAMRNDEDMQDIPVIIMTASTDNVDKVFGLHIAHVARYLPKPFLIDELLISISTALPTLSD